MIKVIKTKDGVYKNVDLEIMQEEILKEATVNEETGEVIEPPVINYKIVRNPLIPQDLEELRLVVIDTLNWLIGDEVKKTAGDATKLSASNSKAIMLVYKLLKESVDIKTDNLTDTEKAILEQFDTITENGYTDSELLLSTIKAVGENIAKYSEKVNEALKAENVDELIAILESL